MQSVIVFVIRLNGIQLMHTRNDASKVVYSNVRTFRLLVCAVAKPIGITWTILYANASYVKQKQ